MADSLYVADRSRPAARIETYRIQRKRFRRGDAPTAEVGTVLDLTTTWTRQR